MMILKKKFPHATPVDFHSHIHYYEVERLLARFAWTWNLKLWFQSIFLTPFSCFFPNSKGMLFEVRVQPPQSAFSSFARAVAAKSRLVRNSVLWLYTESCKWKAIQELHSKILFSVNFFLMCLYIYTHIWTRVSGKIAHWKKNVI